MNCHIFSHLSINIALRIISIVKIKKQSITDTTKTLFFMNLQFNTMGETIITEVPINDLIQCCKDCI